MAPSHRSTRVMVDEASVAAAPRETAAATATAASDKVVIDEFMFECASAAFPSLLWRPPEDTDDSDVSICMMPKDGTGTRAVRVHPPPPPFSLSLLLLDSII